MSVGYAFKPVFEQFDKDMTSWLYGEWSKEKLQQFELLSNVPVLGSYMNYKLDVRQDEEYLQRYNMSYIDVHDPRKLHQTNSGKDLYGSSINYVSKNVHNLFGEMDKIEREKEQRKKRLVRSQLRYEARMRRYFH